jgi:hypothetical protein
MPAMHTRPQLTRHGQGVHITHADFGALLRDSRGAQTGQAGGTQAQNDIAATKL